MVLTIEKLQLQVAELEKQFNVMNTAQNMAQNLKTFIDNYNIQVVDTKARIDILHKQILELVQEEQKLKKEIEAKNKTEVKK